MKVVPVSDCWNSIPCLITQKRRASAEISCSAVEQEKGVIKAYVSSSDVIDVTSKEINDDHDRSSSSSSYSNKPIERKLITRIFLPLVDPSNKKD
ncbi:uncharacterized protein PGTG_18185 [Puccinia graminis f. sp. tritici CRL 75-36-700-3]|uniref:Uncharacterized protein n=1 Tax=Puccinia graminis f. sp. tritici (strain CRL 75-36-700-3 / race SCCL) TaxID=418459 RepID=E3L7Z5_PUCGT|nr:uncharacterized protein PGTG_18185 [Puccinia graminis f. sp. tritici CRL 75-36-700-3]EFP92670.2 hypothetical protein PGTG_18185 [Puccinia graminis f. sp. tritici CRL 75-36-700-3]